MSFVSRGAKNAFRNPVRSVSVIAILTISMGLALTMLLAHGAVKSKINEVKGSVGNTITVSPAGAQGFEGSGQLLTMADVSSIKSVSHVSSATPVLNSRVSNNSSAATGPDGSTTGNTSLTSPIEARARQNANRNFAPPIRVIGTTSVDSTQVLGVNSYNLISGNTIDGNSTALTALVGKDLAEKNSLKAGSTFSLYGQTVTVAGIYDTGNTFTNAGIVMPLATVQNISGQNGIASVIVQVDSIDNLESTVMALEKKLGSSADVVSQQERASEAVAPLQSISSLTLYSLIGAVASGAVIIFLTMLMIVRERRREIGVFKAIGSSTGKIVTQFISEAGVLTSIAAIFGIVAGALFAGSVTNLLVTSASSSSGGGRGFGGPARGVAMFGRGALQGIQANAGWSVLIYGLIGALVIALIGSAIPAYLIAKIRPAEVMRGE